MERPFYYTQTNLPCGRTFRKLAHLNGVTAWRLAEDPDVRVHRETRHSQPAGNAEELPHLIGLPAAAYDAAPGLYRRVAVEGFVTYRRNLYSAPWRQPGQLLAVRVTGDEALAHGRQSEEVARLALLPRAAPGQPGLKSRCQNPHWLHCFDLVRDDFGRDLLRLRAAIEQT